MVFLFLRVIHPDPEMLSFIHRVLFTPFDTHAYQTWFDEQVMTARQRFGNNICIGGSSVLRLVCPNTMHWRPGDIDVFLPFEGTVEQATAFLHSHSTSDFQLAKITMPTPWPLKEMGNEVFNESLIATGTYTRQNGVPVQLVLYRNNTDLMKMMDAKVLYRLEPAGPYGPDLENVQRGLLTNMCSERIEKYRQRGFSTYR